MALFSDSDFKAIAIDVFDNNIEKHPTVKQIFGKVTKPDVPLILYVAYLYDKNTPLRLKVPDIAERKKEAAELAGLKGNKENIFSLKDEKLVGYVNTYLKYQSSKIWAAMVANEEVLYEYQQELLSPITGFKNDKDKLQALDIKSRLMNECDSIIKRLDAYEDKLFGDLRDNIQEVINYTPESVANM
jgi:DUF1680 family protein